MRRRVQQQPLGYHGRKNDPLYAIRILLTMGEGKLTDHTASHITAILPFGRSDTEVGIAYRVKEHLRQFYNQPDITQSALC